MYCSVLPHSCKDNTEEGEGGGVAQNLPKKNENTNADILLLWVCRYLSLKGSIFWILLGI